MSGSALGGGAEFDRIRAIVRRLGARAAPLGDDCALVALGDRTIALSTDMSVEGVHFRREWLALEEIGWRAAAAALSDLAAVGAGVIGVLAALTVPADEPADSFPALMEGVGAAVGSVGGQVLGGDLSRGAGLALAITVVGVAHRPVRRQGAIPGDRLWISGRLGGARAALTAWEARRSPDPGARRRFARPEPRIALGQWLAEQGATAMLDISDGLAGDAEHLAAASGVGLRIELEALPIDEGVSAEAAAAGETEASFAARGGEDYELLVAMPSGYLPDPSHAMSHVGEVVAGGGVVFSLAGLPVPLAGYDHFV